MRLNQCTPKTLGVSDSCEFSISKNELRSALLLSTSHDGTGSMTSGAPKLLGFLSHAWEGSPNI